MAGAEEDPLDGTSFGPVPPMEPARRIGFAPRIGAVLAGGESRRMGEDKARIRTGQGEVTTWLERVVRLLAPFVETCWVVGREVSPLDCPTLPELPPSRPDLRPRKGPLAGMETALLLAADREVLLVACDLPDLGAHVFEVLIDAGVSRPEADAVAFCEDVCDPTLTGLAVLLRSSALGPIRTALDLDERRVQRLLRGLDTFWVTADASTRRQLRNANSPGDIAI